MSRFLGESGRLSVVAGLGVLAGVVGAVAFFTFSDVNGRLEGVRLNLRPGMSAADALAVCSRMTGDFRLTSHEAIAGWRPGERVFITIDGDGRGAYDVAYIDAPDRGETPLRCDTPDALAAFLGQGAAKIRRFDQLTVTAEHLLIERAIRLHFDKQGALVRVEDVAH